MALPEAKCEQSRLGFQKGSQSVRAGRAFTLSIERDYCISDKYTRQYLYCIFFVDTLKPMRKPKRGQPQTSRQIAK